MECSRQRFLFLLIQQILCFFAKLLFWPPSILIDWLSLKEKVVFEIYDFLKIKRLLFL